MFQERGTASLGQAMPPKPAESREGKPLRRTWPLLGHCSIWNGGSSLRAWGGKGQGRGLPGEGAAGHPGGFHTTGECESLSCEGTAQIGGGFWPCGAYGGETGAGTKHQEPLEQPARPQPGAVPHAARRGWEPGAGCSAPAGSHWLQRCRCDGLGNFCNAPR